MCVHVRVCVCVCVCVVSSVHLQSLPLCMNAVHFAALTNIYVRICVATLVQIPLFTTVCVVCIVHIPGITNVCTVTIVHVLYAFKTVCSDVVLSSPLSPHCV